MSNNRDYLDTYYFKRDFFWQDMNPEDVLEIVKEFEKYILFRIIREKK